MLRVTADTNIYISALNFGGLPGRLPLLAGAGAAQLITSEAILDGVGRVLRRRKFAWTEAQVDKAVRQICRIAQHVTPTHMLTVVSEDAVDNRILECADAGSVDYIVSGDAHLLRRKQHGAIPIIKVADFLKEIRGAWHLPRDSSIEPMDRPL